MTMGILAPKTRQCPWHCPCRWDDGRVKAAAWGLFRDCLTDADFTLMARIVAMYE